jgi:hypothetical protein
MTRTMRRLIGEVIWDWSRRWRTPPKPVADAIGAEREARARNDCRAVGEARRRARQARHDGLRRELETSRSAYQ